jgi:hypothetical protein
MIVVDRALSLTQPWATLMAIDAKRVETRAWNTNYRGWVAIHASKGYPMECRNLCYSSPFGLAMANYISPDDLPLGQILAVTEIIESGRTEHVQGLSDQEIALGDYSPGRYAIFTRGVRRLKQPITIKGALNIWRLSTPITEADLV